MYIKQSMRRVITNFHLYGILSTLLTSVMLKVLFSLATGGQQKQTVNSRLTGHQKTTTIWHRELVSKYFPIHTSGEHKKNPINIYLQPPSLTPENKVNCLSRNCCLLSRKVVKVVRQSQNNF